VSNDNVTHDQILDTVMTKLVALEEKLDVAFGGFQARLKEGDELFRSIEANLSVCLRGLQALLVEKASRMRVEASLDEVNDAVRKLEERDTVPPECSATEEPTQPGHRVPRS